MNNDEIQTQPLINLVGYVDLTESKDKGVMKKIIEQGFGRCPVDGLELKVHYTSSLEDGRGVDNTYVTKEPYIFLLGSFSLVPGLELALKNMKMGERASVRIAPEYSFFAQEKLKNGEMGQNEICIKDLIYPHTAEELALMDVKDSKKFLPLVFEIYLEKFDKPRKHKSQMNTDEKIAEATDLKAEGTALFLEARFQESMIKYKDALEYLTKIPNDELNTKIYNIQQSCLLNIVNCHICLHEYNYALKKLEEYFTVNSKTPPKFYYYRAIAYMNMGEFDNAEKDIKNLGYLLPNDISVDKLKKDFWDSKEKVFNKQKGMVKKGLFSSQLYDDKPIVENKNLTIPEFDLKNSCFYLDMLLNDNVKDPKKIKFEIFKHTSNKFHFVVDFIEELIKNKKLINKHIQTIRKDNNKLMLIESCLYEEDSFKILIDKDNNIYPADEDTLLVLSLEKIDGGKMQVNLTFTLKTINKDIDENIIVIGRCYYNSQFLRNVKEMEEKNEEVRLLITDCGYTYNI